MGHEMKGNQRHPPPISIDPGACEGFEKTLFYYMLLDLCITLLLENLQSVFGSEECVTIAKKTVRSKKSVRIP